MAEGCKTGWAVVAIVGLLFATASGTCTLLAVQHTPSAQPWETSYDPIIWYFGGLFFGASLGILALGWRSYGLGRPRGLWQAIVDGLLACAFGLLSIGFLRFLIDILTPTGGLFSILIMFGGPGALFGWIAYRFWRRAARAYKRRHG